VSLGFLSLVVFAGLVLCLMWFVRQRRTTSKPRAMDTSGTDGERLPTLVDDDEEELTELTLFKKEDAVLREIDVPEDDVQAWNVVRVPAGSAAHTGTGSRKQNADAFLVLESLGLYAVADGVGRGAPAALASNLAVEVLKERFARDRPRSTREAITELNDAFSEANRRVRAEAGGRGERYVGMATTQTAMLFSASRGVICICHVGNARCYRLRADALQQLTRDHTNGRRVSRAIGAEDEVAVDIIATRTQERDTFLLCSNGLTHAISDAEIRALLAAHEEPDAQARALIDRALSTGKPVDNVTALVVRVKDLFHDPYAGC
jgi:protein phosphatase